MNRILLFAFAAAAALPFWGAAAATPAPAPDSPAGLVIEQLGAALGQRGIAAPRQVELDNPMLVLPKGMDPQALRLDAVTVDARAGRVTAVVASATGPERLRVTAQFYQLATVLVPARVIEPGEIIGDRDLEPATVRLDHGGQDPLGDPAAFIGKTPRHPLRAHEPVRAADLQSPVVVHRGELVTMVVETPLMTLSAQGQAMEDAARGDAIRVTNSKSSRVIEGVVTGPGTVSVEAGPTP
ncbi:MAG: flagellar basal body P-ring formation protein FlgA [Alphaproteobacteria bacterium]|nr:flagellar basal body P-ring formation protein FlgA [Alphaproteobacteria bacterium]